MKIHVCGSLWQFMTRMEKARTCCASCDSEMYTSGSTTQRCQVQTGYLLHIFKYMHLTEDQTCLAWSRCLPHETFLFTVTFTLHCNGTPGLALVENGRQSKNRTLFPEPQSVQGSWVRCGSSITVKNNHVKQEWGHLYWPRAILRQCSIPAADIMLYLRWPLEKFTTVTFTLIMTLVCTVRIRLDASLERCSSKSARCTAPACLTTDEQSISRTRDLSTISQSNIFAEFPSILGTSSYYFNYCNGQVKAACYEPECECMCWTRSPC